MPTPRLEDTLTAVRTFFEENPEESGATLSQIRDMLIRMMGEKDAFHPGPSLLEAIKRGLLVREKRIKKGVKNPVYHYSLPGELALVTCQQLAEKWDLPRRKIHTILSKRGVQAIDRSQKGHQYPAGFANEAVAAYLKEKSNPAAAPNQESAADTDTVTRRHLREITDLSDYRIRQCFEQVGLEPVGHKGPNTHLFDRQQAIDVLLRAYPSIRRRGRFIAFLKQASITVPSYEELVAVRDAVRKEAEAPVSSEPPRLDRLQQKVAENISKVARDLQGINEEIDRLIAPLREKRNALERELGELHESREQLEHAKALLDELEARL